jgi:hypothetical protein
MAERRADYEAVATLRILNTANRSAAATAREIHRRLALTAIHKP